MGYIFKLPLLYVLVYNLLKCKNINNAGIVQIAPDLQSNVAPSLTSIWLWQSVSLLFCIFVLQTLLIPHVTPLG